MELHCAAVTGDGSNVIRTDATTSHDYDAAGRAAHQGADQGPPGKSVRRVTGSQQSMAAQSDHLLKSFKRICRLVESAMESNRQSFGGSTQTAHDREIYSAARRQCTDHDSLGAKRPATGDTLQYGIHFRLIVHEITSARSHQHVDGQRRTTIFWDWCLSGPGEYILQQSI